MSIINEVFSALDVDNLTDTYRYYNLGGKVVYIENFVRVNTFSQTEIVLKLKKGLIKVSGDGLIIEELNQSSLVIKGVIKGVDVY